MTSRFSPPQSIVDHFENHSSQITEALSHFDFVDYNALVEGREELESMTPWSPTSSRIFGFLGGSLIGSFFLAAVVVYLAWGRILSCLLGLLCPRVMDGLAAPLEESAARAITEAGVARVKRLMRAAPKRLESEEMLRRLPISPASTPEPSDVDGEGEDQEEPVEGPTERAHVDVSRFPLFPRAADIARPNLDLANL